MDKHEKELMELKHEAVPGFKTLFCVIFSIGVFYLALILYLSLR
jgi:hypothetical protein